MENKNSNNILVAMFLLVGISVGWFLAGASNRSLVSNVGMHQMPDGSMMENDGDMSSMMNGMAMSLKGKSGDDLDKAFLNEMIIHHEGAVEMARYTLNDAKHPELRELSKGIIEAQTKEIAEMKEWRKLWYNQ